MLLILKPVLMTMWKSRAFKELIVAMCEKVVTDTTIDDQICDYVEKNLIGPRIEN